MFLKEKQEKNNFRRKMKIENTKQFTQEDRVHLIEEVRLRRDKTNAKHSNKQVLAKCWLEIKEAMDTNEREFTGFLL
jgi:hypothetical protein